MTTELPEDHGDPNAAEPLALRLSEGLGHTPPLVERLRLHSDSIAPSAMHLACKEAADEIERLRFALGDAVGKRMTLEEAARTDGKSGPYLWWGNVPPGWFLYCGPGA